MRETSDLNDRRQRVLERIDSACRAAGRSAEEITLLAVSKTREASEIRTLCGLGSTAFGENYVDEACAKLDALDDLPAEWHFIGPVQSNKTRALAERFDWVQSVDRTKIARRLSDQRPAQRGPLNVLIQVDVDDEPQKAGCRPEDLLDLAADIASRPGLALRGLMAIPAPTENPDDARPAFARLASLLEDLRRKVDGPAVDLDTLSMGMSGDLEAAILEGSTMVRVGTALFGPRNG